MTRTGADPRGFNPLYPRHPRSINPYARDRDKAAVVRLADAKGKPRIKLSVDATGAPKLEFLDETGKVTYSLPQDSKADKK